MELALFFGLLLLLGLVFGFISSTPLGPINLLVAENYFSSKKIKIVPFLAGVIFVDALFAYLALLGLERAKVYLATNNVTFIDDWNLAYYVKIIGALCILLIGVLIGVKLLKKKKKVEKAPKKLYKKLNKSYILAFVKGAFLCGSNPGFVAYWMSISSTLKGISLKLFPNFEITDRSRLLIAVGIVLGDIIWFGLFIFLLKKGSKKFSDKVLFYVRMVISVGLILMGLGFLFNTLGELFMKLSLQD